MGSGEISLFRHGSGRPVLFLHAAGGAGNWEPFHEPIAQTEKDMAAFARFAREPYLHDPELPARLPRITCPTLVVAAEVDVIIPRAHSEAYAAAIPGAVLRELPRAAHGMHHERPVEVA